METVCNITHGLFTQYRVGLHSYEWVDFLMFENQSHLMEQPEEMRERYRTDLKRHIRLMEMMQRLVFRFLLLRRLEVWRCMFHFGSTGWINRTRRGVNFEMIIADFDCRFERVLQEMEAEARE